MDLQTGYWQIDVEEFDREKTASITPDRVYEFKVMPFGLCNAPAMFEKMIDNLPILCLNAKKCKFGAKTITFLGHELSGGGMRPDTEKIRVVCDFPAPKSLEEAGSLIHYFNMKKNSAEHHRILVEVYVESSIRKTKKDPERHQSLRMKNYRQGLMKIQNKFKRTSQEHLESLNHPYLIAKKKWD
ncbi:hypothetical protein LAZ67_X003004 [Cordylochernes scorpioides]|uniref:Reverse transcriptase domain-containing protein n=1 Tax=Cordylochernes scorpioides TaxID=51811 RepID=A0ABY6LTS7_9ARAC|nr:hypothetical protein LAZ67_X003004 [Cordylochernes scorpioides]